ncbi:MAG: pre-peptidase [Planctomycetaceae bacterium]|nr:pre-peptidase [Planctomycetaceae bacterium]
MPSRTCTLVCCQLLCAQATLAADPPELSYLYPAGACPGSTVTLQAGGTLENWPVNVLIYGDGIAVGVAEEQGKLDLVVDPDADPGVRWLRIYDQFGASSLRPVMVGALPEVVEQEPNDDPLKAQHLASSVTANGRLEKEGDVDCYSVQLREGQTLVADMLAHRVLASPMDGLLQVCTAAGIVLGQNDDECGLDPRLVFTAPADGKYLIRTFAFPAKPDKKIALSGAESYVYRLTITTDGFVDHAFPMAVSASQPTSMQLFGWNLPQGSNSATVMAPSRSDDFPTESSKTIFFPEISNSLSFSLHAGSNVAAAALSDPGHPQSVDVPVTITGRIETLDDRDSFRFQAQAGHRLAVRVESRSLGYTLDPVLRLADAKGNVLNEVDDTAESRDAAFDFEVPSDGEYQITIRDLHGHGGFRYIYRLTVEATEPDFALTLGSSSYRLTPGEPLEIPVTVERKHGFSAEIDISATQLPQGVQMEPARSLADDDPEKPVQLTLTAAEGGKSGVLRITGSCDDDSSRVRTARYSIPGSRASHDLAWVTVLKSAETDEESQQDNESP